MSIVRLRLPAAIGIKLLLLLLLLTVLLLAVMHCGGAMAAQGGGGALRRILQGGVYTPASPMLSKQDFGNTKRGWLSS